MTQVYGSEKIRRTCAVRGREAEGRFGLLRKNVNVSKVLTPNGDGEEQEVDTALVYDERIQPRPPRPTARPKKTVEAKIHSADKPQRRLCLVEGRGETKYHLLRKSTDGGVKILEVGVAGQGEWIPISQIREEFLVPVPLSPRARARYYVERKPVKICKLATTGDQEYLVLRTSKKGTRIVPVYDGHYGQTVDPETLVDVRTINQAAKKGEKAQEANGQEEPSEEASPSVVAQAPQPSAPVQHAPVQHAPVQHAPAQHAPAQQPAPQAAAPPQAAQPQPARPAPTQMMPGQPRPAPVGVAPRPQQPGRPMPQPQR